MSDQTKYFLPVTRTRWFFAHENNQRENYIAHLKESYKNKPDHHVSISHDHRSAQTGVTVNRQVTKEEQKAATSPVNPKKKS